MIWYGIIDLYLFSIGSIVFMTCTIAVDAVQVNSTAPLIRNMLEPRHNMSSVCYVGEGDVRNELLMEVAGGYD